MGVVDSSLVVVDVVDPCHHNAQISSEDISVFGLGYLLKVFHTIIKIDYRGELALCESPQFLRS